MKYEFRDEQQGGLKPANILNPAFLEVVGYEVNIETINKEAHNERSHSQEV